ncbi:MAG TPA: arginine--tRNA ligase [Bacteroidetes bacterium]|nr:arginine--tRNA ligase [Bacteroidota bacterium]
MSALQKLKKDISEVINELTGNQVPAQDLTLTPTKKEFDGDYTLLVFPLARHFGKSPQDAANILGEHLVSNNDMIQNYNVIKGFLNLSLSTNYWINTLKNISEDNNFGQGTNKKEKVIVEFSSPNTNKPLHLGHIRNILLGWSISKILEKAGYEVVKTQIVNDRGIAICKSMLAWQKWGNNITPESQGKKGDLVVGDFYVLFDKKFNEEYKTWQNTEEANKIYFEQGENLSKEEFFKNFKNEYFNNYSLLGEEARQMLIEWEKGNPEVLKLWKMMNGWVLNGFEETYRKLEVGFDKSYFESDTFILGKDIVEEGLKKEVFYKEKDGSVWVDLEDIKMDKKIILRSDGTSVYITQDMGTADLRYKDFGATKMIYVVGDEQEYHFKVLFEIMKRLQRPYAEGMYHLSYGMVELPTGKMKSREGTVVDADDLIDEVIHEAKKSALERGELEDSTDEEREEIYRKIGMAALKFFLLKVNPKRRIVFNPEESVDLQGQTGPYIQNAFVRIKSILRKNDLELDNNYIEYNDINQYEKTLISTLSDYPTLIQQAALEYEPSSIANFAYDLAKKYHKFYSEVRVLSAENIEAKKFRLQLSKSVANTLQSAMDLLGISMPERM